MGRVMTDSKVTEKEKKMSKEEKLELINQELLEFLEYCNKNGYSKEDINKACGPLWSAMESVRRRRLAKIGIICIMSLVTCVILATVNPFARFTAAVGRELTIKILPYWDWTQLYYDECLISNPYYEDVKLTADACKSCEDFKHNEHVSNVTHGVMSHEYLYSNIPVVVNDATGDWLASKLFTSIDALHQVHLDNDRLREGLPCELITNVNLRSVDNLLLLSRATAGEYKRFYAIWQQCDVSPSKAMRSYITRPYFLPPMVEMVRSNWIIISRDYNGDKYKEIPLKTQVVYIAQILGSSEVMLEPNHPCNKSCHTLTDTLKPGHTLVYTSNMWKVSWLPSAGIGETIAISTGGYYD